MGTDDLFHKCKATKVTQLQRAVANAKRANETAKRNGTDNPTTQMDGLVDYLKGLK